MQDQQDTAPRPVWIRGPQLRKRWGDMPNSTFYSRLQRGLIPPPSYPFGPTTPYWALDEIEAHERNAQKAAA
jgi:hypothetical protein